MDANGAPVIYGPSVQRDTYTKSGLFISSDVAHLQTWWQLHDGGNLEHALGGWWNLPLSPSRTRTRSCRRGCST
jgi:hypothetical protein